ncbi:ABC transporter substrate-binding protein, partial [Cutibacterium acnes]
AALLTGWAGAVAAQGVATHAAAPVRLALIETLSGPMGNAGEAVFRNLVWGAERVNARGGVEVAPGVRRPLQIVRYDSKGQPQEALSALQSALDDGITLVAQGNSSAVAAALIEAINRHNEREPQRQALFLNYSAVDPVLTNERCSFWHFRFDAHADMRMAALMSVLKDDASVRSVYLIGQDYSFGQAVLREA